jgi:catechol 2,3-dioxygenase-like lactoylglutathione lyase family enzyme
MEMLVNIDVDDLERAETFYTAAFGLEVERRLGATANELVDGLAAAALRGDARTVIGQSAP